MEKKDFWGIIIFKQQLLVLQRCRPDGTQVWVFGLFSLLSAP